MKANQINLTLKYIVVVVDRASVRMENMRQQSIANILQSVTSNTCAMHARVYSMIYSSLKNVRLKHLAI